MKGAVFSSGGVLMSYTAGRLCSMQPKYDVTVGLGVGTSLAAFSAIGEYGGLHNFIFDLSNASVYTDSPFNESGDISIYKIIKRHLLKRKWSWGSIKEFSSIFQRHFSEMLYNSYHSQSKKSIFVVYNMDDYLVEEKIVPKEPYIDFCKYSMASMSVPLIFSNIKVGKNYYNSPAHIESLPIKRCIDMGCDEIDVFTHITPIHQNRKHNDFTSYIMNFIHYFREGMQRKELMEGLELAKRMSIKVRVFYIPILEHKNELDFDQDKIRMYFDMGYAASDFYLTDTHFPNIHRDT